MPGPGIEPRTTTCQAAVLTNAVYHLIEGVLDLNWLNAVGAAFEFELPPFELELESELNCMELDSEMTTTEYKSDTKSCISLPIQLWYYE